MATVRVEFASWLSRSLSAGQGERLVVVEQVSEGITVGELFGRLAGRYPKFAELVYDPHSQELTGGVSVIVNNRLVELLDGVKTRIKDGDVILLLPAFAGG